MQLQRRPLDRRHHLGLLPRERRRRLRRHRHAQRQPRHARLPARRHRPLQRRVLMLRRWIGDPCVHMRRDVFEPALRRDTADFLGKVFPKELFHGLVETEHLWRADVPVQFETAVDDAHLQRLVRSCRIREKKGTQLTWSSIAVLSRSTCSSRSEWRVTYARLKNASRYPGMLSAGGSTTLLSVMDNALVEKTCVVLASAEYLKCRESSSRVFCSTSLYA